VKEKKARELKEEAPARDRNTRENPKTRERPWRGLKGEIRQVPSKGGSPQTRGEARAIGEDVVGRKGVLGNRPVRQEAKGCL